MRNSEKAVFLAIMVAAVLVARAIYPGISGIPPIANGDAPQLADAQAVTQEAAPPTLVLPQTSVAASPSNGSPGATGTAPVIGNASLPALQSNSAYLVADLSNDTVVAGSNIDKRWPTASLTKLMTATLALDQIPTSTAITVTPQMFAADPDEITLVSGGTYRVEDLLHVMLMPSSNVAAESMADTIGHATFINEMNQRAGQWGMTNTYFADPSGISAANESSAKDLMTLAEHVYRNYPDILSITDTPATTITELNSGRIVPVKSINAFAGQPGFIGGKTGNTPQAGYNLLSLFSDNGRPVLIIVLGENALPFGDTAKLYSWFRANYH